MIDGQTYARLQDVIRREGRSLLQYAAESYPWTNTEKDERPARLHQLAADEREAAAAVARLLVKHRLSPPWLGAYPMGFTSFNYLAFERLLPLLAEHQRRDLTKLESDLHQLHDPDVHPPLQQLVQVKKTTLEGLEALLSPPKAPS